VKLAARGQRDMDAGPESITDVTALRQVHKQARAVHMKSLAVALIVTAVFLIL
jgi:uncharacterized membrane protein YozB (DUF420 family)